MTYHLNHSHSPFKHKLYRVMGDGGDIDRERGVGAYFYGIYLFIYV